MNNPTLIAPGPRTFDINGALSAAKSVKTASSTVEAKAGHLLVHIHGAWYAYGKTTNALAQTVVDSTVTYSVDAIGILLEDASFSTTAKSVQVLIAGKVWEDFIRNAGIEAATTSLDALQTAPGKIIVADAKEVE